MADADPPLVAFISLGCCKNLVDSEKMLGQLAESGVVICGDESTADTIVVNTCGFLDAAREEALEIIEELAERKRTGTLRRIVVAGCLVQRDREKLLETVPEIDAIVGVNNRDDVARAVLHRSVDNAGQPTASSALRYLGDYVPAGAADWSDRGRLRLTPNHYAYVRISEGCNQRCTFCTIPAIRGPLHGKRPETLAGECRELIDDGARELILIGQDTTSYGVDLGYQPGLAGLLRLLDQECDGARWLRLMYVYPSIFTDEMIAAIAECERVVKYIDIPLQHINDRVLKAMGRRVTRKQTEDLLERLRRSIPGVVIRTTFIVGFPGETEAEFAELLDFACDFGFDAVGAFQYSHEPDTPAARLKGRVDDALIQERHERLMLAQQEIAFAAAREKIGTEFEIVIDESNAETPPLARHAGQAPDVDSVCVLESGSASPGEFMRVRCVGADDYDLIVRPM